MPPPTFQPVPARSILVPGRSGRSATTARPVLSLMGGFGVFAVCVSMWMPKAAPCGVVLIGRSAQKVRLLPLAAWRSLPSPQALAGTPCRPREARPAAKLSMMSQPVMAFLSPICRPVARSLSTSR